MASVISGTLQRTAEPLRALQPRAVLCVLPNAEIQRFALSVLCDFRMTVTATAIDALRWMHSGIFDAYVLDYWLPDWTGPSLCRDIRRHDPHVPICFYTTAMAPTHRARALRAGASAFLEAPTEGAALSRRLHVLLDRADAASLHAMAEGTRVIQEELERRATAAAAQANVAIRKAQAAIERAAKIKARKAFVEAGGASAHFARWWPQQFDLSWEAHCPPQEPGK